MSRQRLSADPFMVTLKRRAELGFEWFDATVKLLRLDLENFQTAAKTNQLLAFSANAYEIKVEAESTLSVDDNRLRQPFTLTLTTRYAKVKLVANDPLGWLCLEVDKRSAVYDGVLARGAAEIVLNPAGISKDPLHWVESDWLSSGGLDYPQSKESLADKLWEVLFHPQIRDQVSTYRDQVASYRRTRG
jgi:hypothetical protein